MPGGTIGPLASGALLERFEVASVFWVQVPTVAIALTLGAILVPTGRDKHPRRLDVLGSLLSVAGVGLLISGMIEAPERGWTDGLVLCCLAGSVVVLSGFAWSERRSAHPMLPLHRLRDRGVSTGVVTMVLLYSAMFGLFFIGTNYFQFLLGFSPFQAGAASLPLAVALLVGAPLSDRLAGRLGQPAVVAAGVTMVAVGVSIFVAFDQHTPYGPIAVALAVFGFGVGLAAPQLTTAILRPFPARESGIGSAVTDVSTELGASLGIAVMGSILSAGYLANANMEPANWPAGTAATARKSVGDALLVAAQAPADVGPQLTEAAKDAFVAGMAPALLTGAALLLLGALLALTRLPRTPHEVESNVACHVNP